MSIRTLALIVFSTLSILSLPSEGLALRSPMTGIDFHTVELRLVTLPQYKARLYERASRLLAEAGLAVERTIDHHEVESGKAYTLLLTLFPYPLEECPNHFSYTHRIELQEWVYLDRLKGRAPMMSWVFKTTELTPHLVERPVTIERLEKDLDQMVSELIQHYKAVNVADRP